MIKTFKPSYQKQEALATHFDFTFRLARPFKFLATPSSGVEEAILHWSGKSFKHEL